MQNPSQKSNHKYKDTLFRTLFGNEKYFLELYNAVADEHYPSDTPVIPCPANEMIARCNDIAARIGDQLIVFFEHQSTRSLNMPLRFLSYVTDILNLHIINRDKLFGEEQVKIPTPKFYVIYNGEQSFGAKELKLSDAFIINNTEPALELTAKILNINLGSGEAALTRSVTLQGYSYLINEIRTNIKTGMTRDKAVATAIDFCIKQGILTEFLKTHYTEVSKMLNWEYDEEAVARVRWKAAHKKGHAEGHAEANIKIARKLKSAGTMKIAEIAELTGLTIEEIEAL